MVSHKLNRRVKKLDGHFLCLHKDAAGNGDLKPHPAQCKKETIEFMVQMHYFVLIKSK